MPSNPYDAKGLLIASIEDDDPVVFFEPKRSTTARSTATPPSRRAWSTHPRARCRTGTTSSRSARRKSCARARLVTIVTYGTMVYVCEAAPGRWHRCRDHRRALDGAARRGHYLHVREEDRPLPDRARGDALLGFGAELSATIQEGMFLDLEAPIQRSPVGYALPARGSSGSISPASSAWRPASGVMEAA